MSQQDSSTIVIPTGRFERFEQISWWDQQRLRDARVLVVGAGALGNEVVKNLSLLGVGNLAIADMDRIEESNLVRSVLFQAEDEGRFKAEVAAEGASRLYPDIRATALVGNILGDVGLGWFRWADAVVGALDNREARVFVNSTCATLGKTWFDGGIEVLNGIVRGFSPPDSACYECTMGQADWDDLNQRRSCSLLARQAIQHGGTPTTPTTASVIGAIQAQEVVKCLHGMEHLAGTGFVFEGTKHNSFTISMPKNDDCPWHEPPSPVATVEDINSDTSLSVIWNLATERLGGLDAIDLSRELVTSLTCVHCNTTTDVYQPIHKITAEQAVCAVCNSELTPNFLHSIGDDSPVRSKTASEIGLPKWDIVWARRGEQVLGIELAGDCDRE